mgnify:CR=1 FL=1
MRKGPAGCFGGRRNGGIMTRMQTMLGMAATCFAVMATARIEVAGQAQTKTVWDGVFTAAQAQRGMKTYLAQCASCHGEEMKAGPGAPSIAGPEFQFGWDKKPVGGVADYIKMNMPPGQAGSLKDADVADLVAAILKTNGFPESASTELSAIKAEQDAITLLASKP